MFIETAATIPSHLVLPPAWRGEPIGAADQDSEGVPAVWRTVKGWSFGYESGESAIVSRTVVSDIEAAQRIAVEVTRESCEGDVL